MTKKDLRSIATAPLAGFRHETVTVAEWGGVVVMLRDIVVFTADQGLTAGVIWNGQIWSTAERGAGPTNVIAETAWGAHG